MSAACKFCDDTGSLSKDLDGFYDCTHCGIADERTSLEAWAEQLPNCRCFAEDLWAIYLRGKEAGKMLNAAPNL